MLSYLLRSKIPFLRKCGYLSSVPKNRWAFHGFSCPNPRHPRETNSDAHEHLDYIRMPQIAQAKGRK